MADYDLSGILADPQFQSSPAMSPANRALMTMGLGILSANQPSRLPINPLSVIGQGGLAGLQAYQQAREDSTNEAMNKLRMGVLYGQARKAQSDLELQDMLLKGGALGSMSDPDKMEALGTRLAVAGHPGGSTLISQAEKLRQLRADRETSNSFKSAPGVLGAGVTTSSQQGQQLLSQGSGDPSFDAALLQSTNAALNSNPNLSPQPIQAPRPGLFGVLSSSPYVGPAARAMQAQLDASRDVPSKTWLDEANRLQQQHMTASNAATAREDNAALRRELANLAGENRRGSQQNLQEQRVFTRERELSQDYNNLSKPFRNVLPAFQSSAQYLAGGKYDSSGDRALAFSYAKMLDPSDRVGVNDIRDINKLGNVPERIQQAIVSLAEGKELPDRIRQEMFQVMRGRFNALNEQQRQIEDEYETRARGYMLNPSNVVIRHSNRGSGAGARGGWSIQKVPGG
jgi:hypothetical protein